MNRFLFCISFLLFSNISISQINNLFDTLYINGVDKVYKDISISQKNLSKLQNLKSQFTAIEKAKINYLKFKIHLRNSPIESNSKFINITSDKIQITDSLLIKGINLIKNSDTDAGLKLLFSFLDKTKANSGQKYKKDLCKIYISEGYRKKREFKKGIYILYSIIYTNNISKKNLAFAYNRMSANYNEWETLQIKNTLDSVIKYSKLSIKLSNKYGYNLNLASSLNELGYVYANKLYEYNKAEKNFKEAIKFFKKGKSYKSVINTSINLSNLYLRKGENAKAMLIAKDVIDICDIIGNENEHMRLYLQLAKIYSYNNLYKEAYEFLTIGRKIQEELNYKKNDKTINKLAAKYDLKLKEIEIKNEKQKFKVEEKQNLLNTSILILLIIILLISSIIIFLKNKNILQQKKIAEIESKYLKALSDIKNKDFLHVIAKKQNHDNILLQIKDALNSNNIKAIKNIINENINTENKWDDFFITFSKLNPNFFSNIGKNFPQLTENDKKLLSVLHMKFKTKDIANILNITENSVKKSRQRLRKKLNIEKGADISKFISKTT